MFSSAILGYINVKLMLPCLFLLGSIWGDEMIGTLFFRQMGTIRSESSGWALIHHFDLDEVKKLVDEVELGLGKIIITSSRKETWVSSIHG